MESIFEKYYSPESFHDRFADDKTDAVDVIIPVIHTNELWEKNLISYYREIPINRLLIGDGGCIDNSLEILKKFPRVTILDHRTFTSLGYSLKKLIAETKTEWFIYLHSDVYLPGGWFEVMKKNQTQYDWYECRQQITALVEYPLDYTGITRPFSGSQMGRSAILREATKEIDDDFLYRNEDIVIADLVKRRGHRYGRVDSTYHYHQVMFKPSRWGRQVSNVEFIVAKDPAEDIRESTTQTKGIIKYMPPSKEAADVIQRHMMHLLELKQLDVPEFKSWIRQVNSDWLPLINKRLMRIRLLFLAKKMYHHLRKITS